MSNTDPQQDTDVDAYDLFTFTDDMIVVEFDEDSGVITNITSNSTGSVTHGGYPSVGISSGTITGNTISGNASSGGNFSSNYNWPNTTLSIGSSAVNGITLARDEDVKSDVEYVIVLNDNSTLVLDEQTPITPREMVGITKFLQIIQMSSMGVAMQWSELIEVLGIERHFCNGPDYDQFPQSDSVLYFFLHDAE